VSESVRFTVTDMTTDMYGENKSEDVVFLK